MKRPAAAYRPDRAQFHSHTPNQRGLVSGRALAYATGSEGLPHEESDPSYAKLLNRISLIADIFADRNIQLGFETGQESADTLREFLSKLDRPNVGVNFDPANMILYEKGDPISSLRILAPWLKQCHIKDANRTRIPGHWGDEVTTGTGQVNWPVFFKTLEEIGYNGWLCIEREAGHQRMQDIQA